jgi:hypothetical protein
VNIIESVILDTSEDSQTDDWHTFCTCTKI